MRCAVGALALAVVAPLLGNSLPQQQLQRRNNVSALGRKVDQRLCEALRQSLPDNCLVAGDCFGFVCLADVFGVALTLEASLQNVCDQAPSVTLAIQERLAVATTEKAAPTPKNTPTFLKPNNSDWLVVNPDVDRSPAKWQPQNEGCYDISVHQCDCDIPDAETCAALNVPGSPARFFWTPGCDACFQPRDWAFVFENNGPPGECATLQRHL